MKKSITAFLIASSILATSILGSCGQPSGSPETTSPSTEATTTVATTTEAITPIESTPAEIPTEPIETTEASTPEETTEAGESSTEITTESIETTVEATPEISTPEETPATTPVITTETEPETEVTSPVETTPIDPELLKAVETFVAPAAMEEMKTLFENNHSLFSCYVTDPAPFAMRNTESISDCRLLSITIPVYKTLAADENGDFIFTISVMNANNMRQAPTASYKIKINGIAYGIEANDSAVFKMITVDLTEYDIVLDENQTIAFFDKADTLFPGYLLKDESNQNEAAKFWKSNAPQSLGFYTYAGRQSSLGESKNSLIFDFMIERTYDTLEEKLAADSATFAAKVEALKEKYSGKNISILGDSISTFRGVSNNINYNKSLSSNAIYYPDNNTDFVNYHSLYWGRLIDDLEMNLCVDNAWSGSRVYGQSGCNYNDSMPRRATELSHRRGAEPDLIIVYMGINDLHNTSQVPFGGLYNKIKNATTAEERYAIVDEWFANVKATAEANPGYIPGQSYSEWAEAYALGLYEMKNKYGTAEIYCMTLIQNKDSRCTAEKVNSFNTCIRALAEYFGIGLIDQQLNGYINLENCYAYCGDSTALHPSPYGHVLMEKLIVETLYNNLIK